MLKEGCVQACRGCAHRGWSASESEGQKAAWIREKLAPWAARLAPLRAVAEAERWAYRDKVCLATAWEAEGWQFGLMARQVLIPIPRCPIHSERVRAAVRLFAEALPPGVVFPMVFFAQSGAQITLVLKTNEAPDFGWLDVGFQKHLMQIGIEGVWAHLNPSAGKRVFAKQAWHLLWGQPRSVDASGLHYGPATFHQPIPVLHAAALDEAEAFLQTTPGDAVVDLYCGIGSSVVRWLRRGAEVAGVELGREAVACAGMNAPGAVLLRGTCAHRLPQLREWTEARTGVRRLLFANPPRTGLEPEVCQWIAREFRPERLAYLSCSAGTLHRDLDILTAAAYRVERLTPYDFFPQTYHVETLALLQRAGRHILFDNPPSL